MRLAVNRVVTVAQIATVLALIGFAAHTVLPDGGRVAWTFDYVVYYAIVVAAMLTTALRALVVPEHRLGWAAMAVAVWSYGIAEFMWLVWLANDPDPPYPSTADAFYLGFYPAAYAGLILLFRSRFTGLTPGLWIDGLTAALAAGALGSAVIVEAVLDTTDGPFAVVATNISYPLGDVILLSLVIAAFSLTAWRPGRTWWLIGASLLLFAVGDSMYLWATATGTYVEGRLLDLTWPAALLLISVAAWRDDTRGRRVDIQGRALLAVPAVCAIVAAAILTADHFHRVNLLAILLSLAALACVLVRLSLTFRENRRLLELTRSEAITDALTGLGNRRCLLTDLATRLEQGATEPSSLLVVFDLDGFKGYNDSFGHPAGDALLNRLGRKLAAAVDGGGAAYRMGGDEFCALAETGADDAERLLDATVAALGERGEGFDVGCSFGAVIIPDEADHAEAALRLADERLYAQKHTKRTERDRPHELLLAALYEREPDLHLHLTGVADLAEATGEKLALPTTELQELRRAAQLHDIGKIAVPDQILHKPGPLDEEEWTFVRQHTVVGERILTASPSLRGLGPVIRATHENWDGSGYPDGLAGAAIPLASRIIAACDAFSAITADRAYRPARSAAAAIEELRRNTGTQFDPAVVDALAACVNDRLGSMAA